VLQYKRRALRNFVVLQNRTNNVQLIRARGNRCSSIWTTKYPKLSAVCTKAYLKLTFDTFQRFSFSVFSAI